MQPPPEVFDLFAVPADPVPVAGGQGHSVAAGDLVLSPGRDAGTAAWLNPLLARLSVDLDHERPRSLRLAMPVPTRDLRWVVDGWGATRREPGARPCHDLQVLVATGRLLHAHLDAALSSPPLELGERDDRWARAERAAFGVSARQAGALSGHPDPVGDPGVAALAADLRSELSASDDGGIPLGLTDLGPDQLVHGDLAGNVLLDAADLPVVIDVAPYWRPSVWAEAVCVLDAVLWLGADPVAMVAWTAGPRRHAMLRAALFRVLSDDPCDVGAYRRVLGLTT